MINHVKTRVHWFYCCTNKDIGGLGLIDPKEAMDTLLFKWVIRALKLGNSNFKLLLCFKLTMCKSSKHMKWGPNVNWALVRNHNPSPKTKVWGISKAWKWMVEKFDFPPPQVAKP